MEESDVVADLQTGLQDSHLTPLSLEEEAIIAALRRRILLPLGDCLYGSAADNIPSDVLIVASMPVAPSAFCARKMWQATSSRKEVRKLSDRLFPHRHLSPGSCSFDRMPDVTPGVLRTLTTRRAQLVEMRKRLWAQIDAREKQGVAAEVDEMDNALIELLKIQIEELEHRVGKSNH